MKTILFATNCTKPSSSALKYAYRLSLALKAQLHILRVFDLLPRASAKVCSRRVLLENFKAEQEELLKNFCIAHLEEHFENPKLFYHTIGDEPITSAILETAERINADLVIIGASRPSALRGVLAENIADGLVPLLKSKLLVLPQDVKFQDLSNLLYATDFDEADIFGLEQMVEIAKPFGAQIRIVHVPNTPGDGSEEQLDRFKQLVKQRISYSKVSFILENAEDVIAGLHRSIKKESPEILAMMERSRSNFWNKLFHKDLVKIMGQNISIGLMVFNKNHIVDRSKLELELAAV